jgi:hypothetical protein
MSRKGTGGPRAAPASSPARNPAVPSCLPGLRPLRVRIDLGGGSASPSTDGGVEEFCEFRPACRFGSATPAFNSGLGQLEPTKGASGNNAPASLLALSCGADPASSPGDSRCDHARRHPPLRACVSRGGGVHTLPAAELQGQEEAPRRGGKGRQDRGVLRQPGRGGGCCRRRLTTYEEVWRTAATKMWVGLRVDLAKVSEERVQELVERAWWNKAPKRVVAAYDAQ